MSRLFGTDGIRGVANVDLKPTLAYALGRAVAHRLAGRGGSIVVGQDTRRSGDMFVAAIVAGATSLGVDVHVVGVVPTPALAYIAGEGPFAAGIMVSASHNPAADNGLKVLDARRAQARRRDRGRARGAHLADRGAARSRQRRPRPDDRRDRPTRRLSASTDSASPARSTRAASTSSSTRRTARDRSVGPEILAATGARLDVIHAEPDGININVRSGATAPASLAEAVVAAGADAGFALDGDADRLIAVDAGGRVVDGDQVLGILALDRLSRGALPGGGLVVSVLSNGGLQAVVEAAGGQVVRTPVGDKYILEGMQVSGAVLGGEKSGHVILLEHTTSGDGIVTALEVLRVMVGRRPRPRRARRDHPAAAAATAGGEGASQGPVGRRPGPPARHRRRDAAAGRRGPRPRPAVRHRARAAGDGRRTGRGAGQRAGRLARDTRRGATRLAPVNPRADGSQERRLRPPKGRCPRDIRPKTERRSIVCAASSATPVRGRRARSSSKASSGSSTAATTRPGSRSSTTPATCSSRSGPASWSTSRPPSPTGRPTRRSGSPTRAGRRTAARTTSTPTRTATAPARSRSSTTGSSRTSASCATGSRPAGTPSRPRPTPRRSPTSSRRPTRATSPRPSATPSAGSRAPTRSRSCTSARATGSSAPARTCRSSSASARTRASSPRTSPRSSPTPTGSSSSRTATSPIFGRGA